jgi:exopolyphosphatase/guanosine-5'-triphosphate,3'-diphosphate pyrophosphatase
VTEYATLAAVDLGSNSFHCQIGRVVGGQIYPLDSLREPVRLAAGLTPDKRLEERAQARALACLARFGERLRGFRPEQVRAVGTNALRVAKNAAGFLKKAQAALGFPIEIVSGREEARLVYLGVSHSLPASEARRLVVDIGGGSTEFILGVGHRPLRLDSLYIGCVSLTMRHFPEGRVSKGAMRRAELEARNELQPLVAGFGRGAWEEAVGSSGTVRAIAALIRDNGLGDAGITPAALERLRARLLEAGTVEAAGLSGLKPGRAAVLPGGVAILSAVLSELGIETMGVAEGALREGLLHDLAGRLDRSDMRELTVEHFMQRYHVDAVQAKRVSATALELYRRLATGRDAPGPEALRQLEWAAKLHEIGVSVAYSGYHRHSAYILEHADMPGFSRQEQARLALLVHAHRRSLAKVARRIEEQGLDWNQVLALRLAVLFNRRRAASALPPLGLRRQGKRFDLDLERGWLEGHPLTANALADEALAWREAGFTLRVAGLESAEAAALAG